jgi:hypothetical protein
LSRGLAIPKTLRGRTFERRGTLRAKRMRQRTVRVDRDQSSGRYPNPSAVEPDALTPGTRREQVAGFRGRHDAPRDLTGFHRPPSRASETAPAPAGPQTRRGRNRTANKATTNHSASPRGLPNGQKRGRADRPAAGDPPHPSLETALQGFGWAAPSTLHLHNRCLSFRKPALSQCSYRRPSWPRSSPSPAAMTNHHNMAEECRRTGRRLHPPPWRSTGSTARLRTHDDRRHQR